MANEITFDKLPQAVGYLTEQVERIHKIVAVLQLQTAIDKHRIVEIDEADRLDDRQQTYLYRRSHGEWRAPLPGTDARLGGPIARPQWPHHRLPRNDRPRYSRSPRLPRHHHRRSHLRPNPPRNLLQILYW